MGRMLMTGASAGFWMLALFALLCVGACTSCGPKGSAVPGQSNPGPGSQGTPAVSTRQQNAQSQPAGTDSTGGGSVIEWDQPASTRILFEAETGKLTAPMTIHSHAKASGGKFVESPEGPNHEELDNSGHAVFVFTVKEAGEYVLWARVGWCCGCGDSLDFSLDGCPKMNLTSGTHGYHWHWLPFKEAAGGKTHLRTFSLSKGEHILTVYTREDGSGLDQVLLTTDEQYVPTGIEEPD